MKNKLFMLLITLFAAAVVMAGCGSNNDEDNNNDNNNNNIEENEDENENNDEANNEEDNNDNENNDELNNDENDNANNNTMNNEENENEDENNDTPESISISDSAFSELIEYMEEETQGEASVTFEMDEEQTHEMEGVTATLHGYTLVELNDFHSDFSIPFNDQTDGGVLIADYTITNDTDEDVYYMPTLDLSFVGASKFFGNNPDLLPEDEQLPTKLAPSNDYLIEAGETVTGYYAYPLGEDFYEDILAEGTAEIAVPQPTTEKDDFAARFGEEGTFKISLDADSAKKTSDAESQGFYEDRVTASNMGDKEMIDSKEDIGESEELGDFTVTLDGYQFTEFEPNKDEAPRFESYDTGIVLLTVKFNVDNQSESEIGINSVTSKLTVNDGSQYMLNEGILLEYRNDDIIDSGDDGEILQIYAMDKEQYDKIWKDKSFEIEIGPMKDSEAKDISKGKKATFDLK